MGFGVAAIWLRDSVQKGLSRQPLPEMIRGIRETTVALTTGVCSGIKDYVMEGETLYRNISQ